MEFIDKIREGYAAFGAYQTWYRVTGDLSTGRTPLVIIHGGPGCTHDYVDAFKDVAFKVFAGVANSEGGRIAAAQQDVFPFLHLDLEFHLRAARRVDGFRQGHGALHGIGAARAGPACRPDDYRRVSQPTGGHDGGGRRHQHHQHEKGPSAGAQVESDEVLLS